MLQEYNKCKNELEKTYGNIAEVVKLGSTILLCEEEEKKLTFFLNLEKTKAVQDIIKKLEIKSKETHDPNEINCEIDF